MPMLGVQAKALNASWALFSCCDTTSKARFRKEWHSAKKAVLRTQDKLLLWSMMARGGRDVRPPGANPSINRITLIALSGIWEGDFVLLVKHLLNRTYILSLGGHGVRVAVRCLRAIWLGVFSSFSFLCKVFLIAIDLTQCAYIRIFRYFRAILAAFNVLSNKKRSLLLYKTFDILLQTTY